MLQSKSGYYTALLIQHGTPVLPEDVRNVLGKYIKQLDEGLEEGGTEESLVDTPVSDPRQGGSDLASEFDLPQSPVVTNLRDDARDFFDSRASELERRIDDGGERIQG